MDAADLSAALSATLQFHGQNRNEWLGGRFVEVGRRTGESLVPAGPSPYLSPIRDLSERVVDTRLTGCRCLLCGMDPCRYPCPAHPAGWRASNPTMARSWVATLSNHSPEPSPTHSHTGPRVVFLIGMRVVTIFGLHCWLNGEDVGLGRGWVSARGGFGSTMTAIR